MKLPSTESSNQLSMCFLLLSECLCLLCVLMVSLAFVDCCLETSLIINKNVVFYSAGPQLFNNAHRHSLIALSLFHCGLEWRWGGVSHYGAEQWINSLFALLPVELTCSDWLNDSLKLSNKLHKPTNQCSLLSLCSHSSPKTSAVTPLHLCFHLWPFLHSFHPSACPLCLPVIFHFRPLHPQGGPVLPGLPEVQAGGWLSTLLPGIHGPQPGCCRSPVHLLRWGRPGEPRRRRGPGQQRWGLWRHQWLPASGLLRYWGGYTRVEDLDEVAHSF